MSLRLPLAAATVALVAVAGWLALRPPELAPIPEHAAGEAPVRAAQAAAPAVAPAEKAGPSSVLAIDLKGRSTIKMAPPPPTLFNEYLGAKTYRILYDRLAGSSEGQTADGRLVMYEILRQCAQVTEGPRPGWRPTVQKRDDFINNLSPTDPQREQRIAAFDQYATDRCKGFEGMSIKHADLMKLLGDSASLGNAQARALLIEQELWAQRRANRGQATLSDANIDNLRQILSTRDPEAVRVAGRVLGNNWNDYGLRIGPDQQPIEQRAFVNAFLILSCEMGAPCGADTPRMLQACALQGHCSAQNYPDYLFYYGSTPHDSQLLSQYREIIRTAIDTGNWSQINVVRGQQPNNRIGFVPGPR